MKNVAIAFILFLILIAFMITSNNKTQHFLKEIIETCENLEVLINDESWEAAYEVANKFHKKIDKKTSEMGLYLNHQQVDDITHELYGLTQYIKEEEKADSLAGVHSIKHSAKVVRDLQKFSIENIF